MTPSHLSRTWGSATVSSPRRSERVRRRASSQALGVVQCMLGLDWNIAKTTAMDSLANAVRPVMQRLRSAGERNSTVPSSRFQPSMSGAPTVQQMYKARGSIDGVSVSRAKLTAPIAYTGSEMSIKPSVGPCSNVLKRDGMLYCKAESAWLRRSSRWYLCARRMIEESWSNDKGLSPLRRWRRRLSS